VIAGPTAIGKTSCAISVAKHFKAEIFSADSRQVYKEMRIGTAKPEKAELDQIRHHFIDHVSIHDPYNAGIYEREALLSLNEYFSKNKIAILTGGTGLYIKSVIDGFDQFPEIPSSITNALNRDLEKKGIEFLQDELKRTDYLYYSRVDLYNARRLIRALSVIRFTQKTFSSFLNHEKEPRNFKPVFILLDMPREALYERINNRVDMMIEQGLLDEAKKLHKYKELKSLQTVGYQELFQYLDNALTFEEAIEAIKQNSRRYAKRQLTWFRNDQRWATFNPSDTSYIIAHIEKIIHPA
jgi:tRNA dimethylallyltransferase